MKSPGSPILGDSLYGGTESETMFLYAWKIQFTYQQFAYFNAKIKQRKSFGFAVFDLISTDNLQIPTKKNEVNKSMTFPKFLLNIL